MFDTEHSFEDQETETTQDAETSQNSQVSSEGKDLKAEIDQLKGDLLRALAETENVRKRSQKEREDAFKYAISNFARDLISISENFKRALESVSKEEIEKTPSVKAFFEGVTMIERELLSVFDRHGIQKIMPNIGDKFDHNLHQAMFEVEDPSKPVGTIVETLQAGYVLNDRLLKPAFVGVSKAGNAG
ncbi:MAG: nucleotide exchange factor GrpE [Proteobacteria bacterium]|nr:nucleotide exchange factor GrpE [Pseudomonadota bacterium]